MGLLHDWLILFVVECCAYLNTDREELTVGGVCLPEELVPSDPIHSLHLVLPFAHSSLLKFLLSKSDSFRTLRLSYQTFAHVLLQSFKEERFLPLLMVDGCLSLAHTALLHHHSELSQE